MDQKQERITTIHDFNLDPAILEGRLNLVSDRYTSAVLIPCLYEELKRPAIQGICSALSTCKFINHIIVVLYAKTRHQYEESIRFFEFLPQQVIILWQHSPRVLELLSALKVQGFNSLAMEGKGKAVWLGLGIASLLADWIVLHDADILTYDRSYPLKLLFPLTETEFNLAVNKAYYARLSPSPASLNGRVFRLFLTPLLDCLVDIFGPCRYLLYLQSFRYPLAGELAISRELALNVRIPNNWGLEIEFLAELYRNLSEKQIAQVDLGVFDHKHQVVGDALDQGLPKMAADILSSLLRTLCELEQVIPTMNHIHALRVKFKRRGQDYIRQYFIDARMNGLTYDRHQEEEVVETFERVILDVGQKYFTQDISPQIGNWSRAIAVMPDLREQLFAAAQLDRQELGTD